MIICQCKEQCDFLNNNENLKENTKKIIIELYCKNEYINCARYILKIVNNIQDIPINLCPHEVKKAEIILTSKNKIDHISDLK